MFENLFKVVLSPVDIVVSATADIVTLGGTLTDKDSTYTGEAASRLMKNIEGMTK